MIRTYYSVAYSFWSKWYWLQHSNGDWNSPPRLHLNHSMSPSTLLRFAANTIGRLCTHLVMMFISLCCADIAIYFDRWLASKSYILSAAGLVRNRHHLIGSLPDGTNLPLDDKVDLGTASIQCFWARATCFTSPPFVCWAGGKSQSRAASLSLCQRTTCILYDCYLQQRRQNALIVCAVCPTTFRVNISGRVGRTQEERIDSKSNTQRKELSQRDNLKFFHRNAYEKQ